MFGVNCLLNSLTINSVARSPFSMNSKKFGMKSFKDSNSFSKIGYYSSRKSHHAIQAHSCVFNSYLDRSMMYNKEDNNFHDQKFTESRISFSFSPVVISNCQFHDIHSPSNSGGAVMSFASLTISNSRFTQCEAKEGGAISCHSGLVLYHCFLRKCYAKNSGAFDIRAHNQEMCNITFTLFDYNIADLFGTFYRTSEGEMIIHYTNISKSTAKQCVGTFETNGGSCNMQYVHIYKSTASVHNGCLCTRKLSKLTINYVAFVECSHKSAEREAAACLLMYDASPLNSISYSYFCNSVYDNSYTVTVVSGTVQIRNCFFSSNKENEINGAGENGKILLENCHFKDNCNCNGLIDNIGSKEKIGIISIKPTKAPLIKKSHFNGVVGKIIRYSFSIVLSLMSSYIILSFQNYVFETCRQLKQPRALI